MMPQDNTQVVLRIEQASPTTPASRQNLERLATACSRLWKTERIKTRFRRNALVRALLVATAVAALFVVPPLSQVQAGFFSIGQTVGPDQLEVAEELSESLANDLLDLSIATRERDDDQISKFFPAELFATRFPSVPMPIGEECKRIGTHAWTVITNKKGLVDVHRTAGHFSTQGLVLITPPRQMSRKEFLADFSSFLEHFADIEDVRFKVKGAHFEDSAEAVLGARVPNATVGSRGQTRIVFYLVGRNRDGQREWTRGVADVKVHRAQSGRWQFESFRVISIDSMVATADLFSEVSIPAGVAASLPPYGSPSNNNFTWHGAAAADFNNDGWIDLFVTAQDRNYLYLNDGQGRFRDTSDEAGLILINSGVAPLAFDYDNDGDQDVFISAVGPQILLENVLVPDGKLEFRDISLKAGVAVQAIGFSAVAGDVNGDGRLDIYVTGYNEYGGVKPDSWSRATNGTPNLLFINQGNGRFDQAAANWGVDDRRWSYAAAFADVNDDGRLDLYVANDFGENGLFVNKGHRFIDEARERGVLDPGYGMGVAFGDYNNDGLLDLHVTNMSSTAGNRILSRLFPTSSPKDNVLVKLAAGNSLYQNTGGGYYRDVTGKVGRFSAGWAWGGGFIDFDNDGWEDLFVPNGFISGKSMKDT